MRLACLNASGREAAFLKKGIPKRALPNADIASGHFVIAHPLFCGKIALENFIVLCIRVHPSYPQTAAHYTAAMAATNALASKRSPSLFWFHFFFFVFLSPVGKCNDMMT